MFRVLILCFSVATMLVAGPVGWCGSLDDAQLGDASLLERVSAYSLSAPGAIGATASESFAGRRAVPPAAPFGPQLGQPPQFASA